MKNLKELTNFSSKVVPVGLDLIVTKATVMTAIHVSKASCKIKSIKKY